MLKVDFSKINSGDVIAVGLSGGEDSVCLLDVLQKNSERLGITVVAINVEHGIRGQSSLSDTEFCKKLCQEFGVKVYCYRVDAPAYAGQKGYSLEQAARELRYDCFFKCIASKFCDKVAVAHHLFDQAETILFNIMRGSSLSGAKGIASSAYEGRIIRPLLGVDKREITAYVRENGLPFVCDPTNDDTTYTRNALRHKVFPVLREIFPKCDDALVRFSETALSDDEYLYKLAEDVLIETPDGYKIQTNTEYPVFSRAVVLAMKRLGVTKDFEKIHVDSVFSLTNNQTGRAVDLPHGLYAIKKHTVVEIKRKTQVNRPIDRLSYDFSQLIHSADGEQTIVFGEQKKIIKLQLVDKSRVVFGDGLYFDLEKLPKSVVFRYKQTGDMFTKFNGQNVTLKKYLTDKKVAREDKSQTIVLADEKNVLIIVGMEISSSIKIDKHSRYIVKLYYSNLN